MTTTRFWLIVVAILAVAVAAYSPALSAPYYFDDLSLYSDPAMLPGGASRVLDLARTRTLTYASFLATFRGGGQDPSIDHAANLAIFLLLITLAAYLYRELIGSRAALAAVVIAALHPLATEPTIYVFARASLLAALFSVAAWIAWVHRKHWSAAVLALLAMASKEEAVVLPVFFVALELMYRQLPFAQLRRVAAPLAAMSIGAALFAGRVLYAASVTPDSGALVGLTGLTPLTYLQAQGRALWVYAQLLVWPSGMNFDHTITSSAGFDPLAIVGWLVILTAITACVRQSNRWPILFLPVGALIFLAPTSTIAPLGDLAAERRMLLPLLCIAPLIGYTADKVLRRKHLFWATALIGCILAGVTYNRAQTWQHAETLWSDTVAKSPMKARPKLHLAGALAELGAINDEEREALLRAAVDVEPESAGAWGELGFFLLQRHRIPEATESWQTAHQLAPDDPTLAVNYGVALANNDKLQEAEALFRTILARHPCHFDARNNLMFALRAREDLESARNLAVPPRECILPAAQMEALARAASL